MATREELRQQLNDAQETGDVALAAQFQDELNVLSITDNIAELEKERNAAPRGSQERKDLNDEIDSQRKERIDLRKKIAAPSSTPGGIRTRPAEAEARRVLAGHRPPEVPEVDYHYEELKREYLAFINKDVDPQQRGGQPLLRKELNPDEEKMLRQQAANLKDTGDVTRVTTPVDPLTGEPAVSPVGAGLGITNPDVEAFFAQLGKEKTLGLSETASSKEAQASGNQAAAASTTAPVSTQGGVMLGPSEQGEPQDDPNADFEWFTGLGLDPKIVADKADILDLFTAELAGLDFGNQVTNEMRAIAQASIVASLIEATKWPLTSELFADYVDAFIVSIPGDLQDNVLASDAVLAEEYRNATENAYVAIGEKFTSAGISEPARPDRPPGKNDYIHMVERALDKAGVSLTHFSEEEYDRFIDKAANDMLRKVNIASGVLASDADLTEGSTIPNEDIWAMIEDEVATFTAIVLREGSTVILARSDDAALTKDEREINEIMEFIDASDNRESKKRFLKANVARFITDFASGEYDSVSQYLSQAGTTTITTLLDEQAEAAKPLPMDEDERLTEFLTQARAKGLDITDPVIFDPVYKAFQASEKQLIFDETLPEEERRSQQDLFDEFLGSLPDSKEIMRREKSRKAIIPPGFSPDVAFSDATARLDERVGGADFDPATTADTIALLQSELLYSDPVESAAIQDNIDTLTSQAKNRARDNADAQILKDDAQLAQAFATGNVETLTEASGARGLTPEQTQSLIDGQKRQGLPDQGYTGMADPRIIADFDKQREDALAAWRANTVDSLSPAGRAAKTAQDAQELLPDYEPSLIGSEEYEANPNYETELAEIQKGIDAKVKAKNKIPNS